MSVIEFFEDTNNPIDHIRDDEYCKVCDLSKWERECDECGGILHAQLIEGSDTYALRCKCGFSANNEEKYQL